MIASQTKVYKDVYDLISRLYEKVTQMPRLAKYTLGQRMIDTSLELIDHIQKANMQRDAVVRSSMLDEAITSSERLKTLMRLCVDKKVIDIKFQTVAATLQISIGSQLTAWRQSTNARIHSVDNDNV